MIDEHLVRDFRRSVKTELEEDILPFWLKYSIDDEHGGFHGRISNSLEIDRQAEKGLILNARILWTFSHACRVLGGETHRLTAERAYAYLTDHFWDPEFGGFYWMVDCRGCPLDTKKKIYGQAFGVYALTEFFMATQRADSLERALRLHDLTVESSYDTRHGGYFETYNRDWTLAEDQRLSDVDLDEKKSMNTHLHVLEAWSSLLRARPDDRLRGELEELIRHFLDDIVDPRTFHFRMFFDENWRPKSDHVSFGHDIEGSWLLCEAAESLADDAVDERVRDVACRMAQAVLEQAVDRDGGLLYEANADGIIDDDKHWWPQAEAVVGFMNAFQLSGQRHFFDASLNSWRFIEKYIVDRRCGEWFWKVSRAGVPSPDKYKVDPWKCPYHNSRTCFEMMARLDMIAQRGIA